MSQTKAVNALATRLEDLRAKGQKALILFVTAGDQPLDELPQILQTLELAGADAIEVGIPFSDPYGEGPTIQASSQRSLDRGVTPTQILEAISKAELTIPVLTMGYYNPVLRVGLDEFAALSAKSGVSGTIISDLVPDEAAAWCDASAKHGLGTVFLVAPTSTDQRIDEVAKLTTGFVYAVSRTGVTGAEQEVPPEVATLVAEIRSRTPLPVCVGFGISKPKHVSMVCDVADGAVVGSALVSLLHKEWNGGSGKDAIIAFVKELKQATAERP